MTPRAVSDPEWSQISGGEVGRKHRRLLPSRDAPDAFEVRHHQIASARIQRGLHPRHEGKVFADLNGDRKFARDQSRAGVVIMLGAAKLIRELDAKPRRTIRVVLFANEEFGTSGSRAYTTAAQAESARHVLGFDVIRSSGIQSRVEIAHLDQQPV